MRALRRLAIFALVLSLSTACAFREGSVDISESLTQPSPDVSAEDTRSSEDGAQGNDAADPDADTLADTLDDADTTAESDDGGGNTGDADAGSADGSMPADAGGDQSTDGQSGQTHAGFKPSMSNTGPRISDLKVHDGTFKATEPGMVVEGLHIKGSLQIYADDVTVRDTKISSGAAYPVMMRDGENALFEHIEVDGMESTTNNGCVYGGDLTIRYSRVHRCTDSAKVHSDSTWEFNYIYDNQKWGGNSHIDGLQSQGARNVVIRGNVIDLPESDGVNSNIFFAADRGDIENITIEGNWFNGGYYTVQLLEGDYAVKNARVIDNSFGGEYRHGILRIQGDVTESGNTTSP